MDPDERLLLIPAAERSNELTFVGDNAEPRLPMGAVARASRDEELLAGRCLELTLEFQARLLVEPLSALDTVRIEGRGDSEAARQLAGIDCPFNDRLDLLVPEPGDTLAKNPAFNPPNVGSVRRLTAVRTGHNLQHREQPRHRVEIVFCQKAPRYP